MRVEHVEKISLEGLSGHDYRDAIDDGLVSREEITELVVEDEIDRIYHNVKAPQVLHNGKQSLAIQGQGFPDVVVWNPWVDRCAGLKDMSANGWRLMLCVEAAATQPITLPAGEEWYGRQTLATI